MVLASAQSQEVAKAPAAEAPAVQTPAVEAPSVEINALALNATAAGVGRRRLTSYKKTINAAKRARRALKHASSSATLEPSPTTKPVGHSGVSRRSLLLQKPKTVQPVAVSVANVLKNLKYEKQQGYRPRDSGTRLVIESSAK